MPDVNLLNNGWTDKWETEIVPAYEEQFDATVAIDGLFQDTQREQIIDQLVQAGNPPEVYYSDCRESATHILQGQTEPVGEFVDGLEAANGSLLGERFITSDDTTHLIPHGLVIGGILNYRADVYDELGLSTPATWNELVENARALDESEQFDGRGFALAPLGSYFTPWLYTAGGSYWRWRDDTSVELAFEEDRVRAALELMQELRRYSPDPAEVSYAGMADCWLGDGLGQCLWPNARLAGFTYRNADDTQNQPNIALETKQAPVPLRDRSLDPPTRGGGDMQGTPLFDGANADSAEQFLRFMYEGPTRQADKNNLSMQYLPPYHGIIDTDEYASSSIYRVEDGHFLDLGRELMENVVPKYLGERPRTPAAWYAMGPQADEQGPITRMVRAVLLEDVPIDEAIQTARRRLQSRLERGRRLHAE